MGVETILRIPSRTAASAMTNNNQLSFSLPSVSRKKVTAAFNGGRLSSDSGVLLLAMAERRRKVADTFAAHISDRRDRAHITHTVADVLRCAFRRSRPVVPTDRDHLIQSIATSGAGCGQVPSGALAISGLPFVVKRERGRPRSQQEGPARAAQCPHG